MTTSLIAVIALIVLIIDLAALFIFIASRHWGVNWYTWLLGLPGSMKKGLLVIISLFVVFLIGGFLLGKL